MIQFLSAYISPDHSIQLEMENLKGRLSKSTQNLQDEIISAYKHQNDEWLLRLGLCDPDIKLSPSLDYFREISQTFTKKLLKISDLEQLRETIQISLSNTEKAILLDTVPMMPGAEYVNDEFIDQICIRIQQFFIDSIAHYNGSVESFIQTFRSDIHLIGQHLFSSC